MRLNSSAFADGSAIPRRYTCDGESAGGRRGRESDHRRTQALRYRCAYIFTPGGIGPTQGDITADCVGEGIWCADRRRSARSTAIGLAAEQVNKQVHEGAEESNFAKCHDSLAHCLPALLL